METKNLKELYVEYGELIFLQYFSEMEMESIPPEETLARILMQAVIAKLDLQMEEMSELIQQIQTDIVYYRSVINEYYGDKVVRFGGLDQWSSSPHDTHLTYEEVIEWGKRIEQETERE